MRLIAQHVPLTLFNSSFFSAVLIILLTHNSAHFGCTNTRAFHLAHHSNSVNDYIMPTLVLYANGKNESTLPLCERTAVCNKIDVYDKPWIEKQCRCPSDTEPCSTTLHGKDGHTIGDKTRRYKLCEPIKKFPTCRYFRDITWTIITKGNNVTHQIVNCICPKDSVAYMIKRQVYNVEGKDVGFKYSFACSPQSRILCQRKDPCRLFTVKRRSNVTEVNTSNLCICPRDFHCPTHHYDSGAVAGKFYPENRLRTYSGYCI